MKRLSIIILLFILSSCGIYSFTGTSIQSDVKSITINYIEYKAQKVNPSLSNDLTEALKLRFRQMTSLEQVDTDGDLEIEGSVTNYTVSASSVSAKEVATQNRLSVTVSISFSNKKYPEEDFQNKTFTAYSDFDATNSLDVVEAALCTEIIDKLIEDIFNATVAQW